MLTAAVSGRGVASVSIVEAAGAEPRAFWIPESTEEPAFLTYSITKTFTASLVLKLCEERKLSLEDKLAKWFPGIARRRESQFVNYSIIQAVSPIMVASRRTTRV